MQNLTEQDVLNDIELNGSNALVGNYFYKKYLYVLKLKLLRNKTYNELMKELGYTYCYFCDSWLKNFKAHTKTLKHKWQSKPFIV